MASNKKTLIVICRTLGVGGIETNAIVMMKNALENGRRVIWVGDKAKNYSPNFREVIDNPMLQFLPCNFSHIDVFHMPEINFEVDEQVFFVTFCLDSCYKALRYRHKYPTIQMNVVCIVPHFTSPDVFLEQTLFGAFQKPAKYFCGKIYQELYNNGGLYFFSDTHAKALINNYNISLPGYVEKVVRNIEKAIPFSQSQRRAIYREKDSFKIVSAGRFEFPHKGFLIGLVKEFATLQSKYPQLELIIIGEGEGREALDNLITSLPEQAQQRITIIPPVPFDQLSDIMLECNLNISVAGCASIGAKAGVLTLPARHYTYDCEVYGFLPDSIGMFTSSEPGFPVRSYIEEAVNMTEEEYVSACEAAYNALNSSEPDINFPFEVLQNTNYYPSRIFFFYIRIMNIFRRFSFLLKRLWK